MCYQPTSQAGHEAPVVVRPDSPVPYGPFCGAGVVSVPEQPDLSGLDPDHLALMRRGCPSK
jgi:hypothetical protein